MLDLCSKELIGYAIAPHRRASLALRAIAAAHRAGLVTGVDFGPNRADAHGDIENWITQYNERRPRSALDYRTPTETRRAWQDRIRTAA